jgi:hypothetical protein
VTPKKLKKKKKKENPRPGRVSVFLLVYTRQQRQPLVVSHYGLLLDTLILDHESLCRTLKFLALPIHK